MLSPRRSTVNRARALRRVMTLPEVLLWRALRARPGGLKFRRQHPAGPYVIDFYCEAALMGIEVDGIAHGMGNNPERDVARDAWLAGAGISILRIPAGQVLRSLEDVVSYIVNQCEPLHHATHGPPPLQGGMS